VSEVDAGLEQLSNSNALGCALQSLYLSLKVVGILRPRLAIRLWISRRTTTRVRGTLRRACVVVDEPGSIDSSDPADVSTRGWTLLRPLGEPALLGEVLPEPHERTVQNL
jgi:hypothetical protein